MTEPRVVAFADEALVPEAPGIASRAGEVTYEFEGGDRGPLHATAGQGFTLPDAGRRHRGRAGPDGGGLVLIDRAR